MSTLKKVLALSLVIAMAFAMMAGAAFTDQSSVKATEQVDLVSALGIMKGYPDGSFKPSNLITRAEATKMLYVINVGKDSGSDSYKSAGVFADVPASHWAAGYVNACAAKKIVAGTGAGFEPEANLTGLQLAKMLLICIGYNPDKSGLTGSQWAINTMSLGLSTDLFEDYTLSLDAPATREAAAIMFYNALYADMVKWSNDAVDYIDYSAPNKTVAEKYFDLVEYEGVLVAADNFKVNAAAAAADDTIYIDRNGNLADWAGTDVALDYEGGKELVGQYVKVLYDDDNEEVFNIVTAEDNAVYNTTNGGVSNAADATTHIKFNGKEYGYTLGVTPTYINYERDVAPFLDFDSTSASNDPIRLVDWDGDDVIDYAFITNYTFGYVASLDDESIDFGIGAQDFLNDDDETVVFADGVAEGDYVLYYKDFVTDEYFVKKCTTLTGEVSGTRAGTVGTDVKVAGAYINQSSYSADIEDASDNVPTIGDSYTIVTDGKYYLGFIEGETAGAAGNFCYVSAAQNWAEGATPASFDDTDAKVEVLMPGEDDPVEYELNEDSTYGAGNTSVGDMSAIVANLVGKFFAYEVKSDGTIELTQDVSNLTTGANVSYNEDTNIFTVTTAGAGDYLLADDAVIFYETNTYDETILPAPGDDVQKFEVYGAGDFDTTFVVTTGNEVSFSYTTVGGFKYIKAAVISTSTNAAAPVAPAVVGTDTLPLQGGTASDDYYGFATSNHMVGKDGDDDYREYVLWVDGKSVTLDEMDGSTAVSKRNFVTYKLNADGDIKEDSMTVNTGIKGAVKAYSSSTDKITITYDTTIGTAAGQYTVVDEIFTITEDTVVAYVDYDAIAGKTGSGFPKISGTDLAAKKGNVYFIEDAANPGELLYIAIDTSSTLAMDR